MQQPEGGEKRKKEENGKIRGERVVGGRSSTHLRSEVCVRW